MKTAILEHNSKRRLDTKRANKQSRMPWFLGTHIVSYIPAYKRSVYAQFIAEVVATKRSRQLGRIHVRKLGAHGNKSGGVLSNSIDCVRCGDGSTSIFDIYTVPVVLEDAFPLA
ncbi:hypothetical protein PM082_008760 [Marasmius tenuissimus]|nr:hypothetical protein PM082_008760 [Marasmius tenuissimus]